MKEIASNERKNQLNIRKTEVIFLLAFFVYMSANTLDLTAAAFGQGNKYIYKNGKICGIYSFGFQSNMFKYI